MPVTAPADPDRHDHPLDRRLVQLADRMRRSPERPVLVGPRGTMTGAAFCRSTAALADALREGGAGPGAAVAILTGGDRFETVTARHAAHWVGAPVVHLRSANARSDRTAMNAARQEWVLRAVGVAVLVADSVGMDRARLLAAAVPGLRIVDASTTASNAGPRSVAQPWPWRPEEPVVIDMTSGSSGMPKLVRHSAASRAGLIAHSAGPVAWDYRPVLLAITPLSHAISSMVDAMLLAGGTVVLAPDAGPDAVLAAVARHGVTDLYLPVPTLYGCVDLLLAEPAPLPSLRRVIYSGTAAAPARIAQAVEAFGDRLAQLYGSTEAGGICTLVPLDHREPELLGSVGRPFPWVELRICEPGTTTPTARGVDGEIHVSSPTVMQGYVGAPAGAVRRLPDGWLHTGDVGHLDEYGYLHLTGRVGDVVKFGGLKIYPSGVARVLVEHPAVADAVAFGVRDAVRQDGLYAAVEPRAGAACSVADLEAHVADRLTPDHVPARIILRRRLPRTPNGKPDIPLLRAQEGLTAR